MQRPRKAVHAASTEAAKKAAETAPNAVATEIETEAVTEIVAATEREISINKEGKNATNGSHVATKKSLTTSGNTLAKRMPSAKNRKRETKIASAVTNKAG